MARFTVDIRTSIDNHRAFGQAWHHNENRRTSNLWESAYHEHTERHHRARIAGADDSVSLAILHEIERNSHRRSFFTQGDTGGLMHRHDLGRRHNFHVCPNGVIRELALDDILIAYQDDLDAKFSCGERRALDDRLRGVIPAHGVNGNSRHKRNRLALLDVNYGAAAVKAAVGARAVRPS